MDIQETQLKIHKNPATQIKTEGIKYSGSKLKLLPYILSIAQSLPIKKHVFDGFSGTTRIGQMFSQYGYQVTSNDISIWSKVFGECYLRGKITPQLQDKINYLNSLEGTDGWFTKHYGGTNNKGLSIQADGKKKIWQIHNTKKLDAIRDEINKIADNSIEHSILLTSLILALDKVDNTLGHYVSYLKNWSPRSFKALKLTMPFINPKHNNHKIVNQDIFKVLPNIQAELSYFDPPYGSNNNKMPPSRVRYASYYHIWKTICLNDQPLLVGKTNRRADCSDQIEACVFEEFRKDCNGQFLVLHAIERLIKQCPSPYILLSYNNHGRITKTEIYNILKKQCKKVQLFFIEYQKNVMSKMCWTHNWTQNSLIKNTEFLFLIEK